MSKNVKFSQLSIGDVFTVDYIVGSCVDKHPAYPKAIIIAAQKKFIKIRKGNKVGAMLKDDFNDLVMNPEKFITGDYFIFSDCSSWNCKKVAELAKTTTEDYHPEPRKPIDSKDNDSYILYDREETEFYRISEDMTRFIEFMNSRSDCFSDRFEIIGRSIDIKDI